MGLFAPDNDELRSREFNAVSAVRGDHKRGLSGGRYEIEDWRRDGDASEQVAGGPVGGRWSTLVRGSSGGRGIG